MHMQEKRENIKDAETDSSKLLDLYMAEIGKLNYLLVKNLFLILIN